MGALVLPGLDVATAGGDDWLETARVGHNEWALAVGSPEVRSTVLAAAAVPGPPSLALRTVAEPAVLLRIELDVCGAWVSASACGGLRPVVVRRAGWVDLRGHGAGPAADDRIGLGPGDALVLTAVPVDHDAVLDRLLPAAGQAAAEVAGAAGLSPVGVLAVPPTAGDEGVVRIERATGVSRDRLVLPGYPLGDQQPDLWHRPPAPPRQARLTLQPEAAEIGAVRQLLRRLLASWRLDSLVEEGDVELLASETATNAMRHAGTQATVIVRYLGDRVRVEVGDGSKALPELRNPEFDEPGGRGLSLVDALSSSWGVVETVDGKRVWFDVAAKPTG